MSTAPSPVSDMLVTVKSREVQRALLAEMRGDRAGAARHFLAGAHLELVLADDYSEAGDGNMALRSRLSAASCFWRAGDAVQARSLFEAMIRDQPGQATAIQEARAELERDYPALAS
jgi:hypothetical protein